MKAYSYFDSSFVGEILESKINESTKIALFCSVQGSMSIHNEKEVWVVANPNGVIIITWCSCMAGELVDVATTSLSCCIKYNMPMLIIFALLLVHLNHVVGANQQKKNHRTEKDKWYKKR